MYQVVENIARLSIFIPLFFFILRRPKTKEIKVIFLFFIFVLLHQLVYSSLRDRSLTEAAILFNSFYTPVELLFAGIYVRYSLKTQSIRRVITYILIVYFFLWVPMPIMLKILDFDYLINGVSYSLIIIFCLLYLYEQMHSTETLFIYMQPPFWGVVAFLLFASGTFFVFLYDQLAAGLKSFDDQYVYIHAIFFTIRNIFFTVAMLINSNKVNITERAPTLI